MKPICVPCQRFFRAERNGYYFTEMMPKAGHVRPDPGTTSPDLWEPYKVLVGDLWRCDGCGTMIVSGVGHSPLTEHYLPDFQATVDRLSADQLQVNDC